MQHDRSLVSFNRLGSLTLGVALAFSGLAGCSSSDSSEGALAFDSGEDAATTAPLSDGDTGDTTGAETTEAPAAPLVAADWAGHYTWIEISGDNVMTSYALTLEEPSADGTLEGEVEIAGESIGYLLVTATVTNSVSIKVTEVVEGNGTYSIGQELFTLSGPAESPTTTIVDLQPMLTGLPPQGPYFLPNTGGLVTPDDESGADGSSGDTSSGNDSNNGDDEEPPG